MSFGADAQHLYSFWEYLHIFFAIFMLVTFLLFLVLCAAANWAYKSWEEIVFPLITTLFIALAVYIDARFCATHRYARPAVRDIYKKLYGTSLDMGK